MNEKENFYNEIKRYFDEGILKEIYSTDDFCILNLSDLFYLACPYFSSEEKKAFGIMSDINNAKMFAENNVQLFWTLKNYTQEDFNKYAVDISDKNFDHIKSLVEKNKLLTPSKFINYDIEQEIMQMNKGKTM